MQKIFCSTISRILSKFSTAFNCKKNLTINQDNKKIWDSWKTITGKFVSYEQFKLKPFAFRETTVYNASHSFQMNLHKKGEMGSNYNFNHKLFLRIMIKVYDNVFPCFSQSQTGHVVHILPVFTHSKDNR